MRAQEPVSSALLYPQRSPVSAPRSHRPCEKSASKPRPALLWGQQEVRFHRRTSDNTQREKRGARFCSSPTNKAKVALPSWRSKGKRQPTAEGFPLMSCPVCITVGCKQHAHPAVQPQRHAPHRLRQALSSGSSPSPTSSAVSVFSCNASMKL